MDTMNGHVSSHGGPVVDLSRSPFAKLHPIRTGDVVLSDRFWLPRITRNREVTIPAQLQQCKETGRIDNLLRAASLKDGPFQGIYFNDSDVYKWVEAAAFSLGAHPDLELETKLNEVIAAIAAAQQPDGYLNSYFMFEKEQERFTNLKDMHEIYCAGHLIQAAIAHVRSTGSRKLLEVAIKLADHLVSVFGPGGRIGACGHEEAEMALVELYRETRCERFLDLARKMTETRGMQPGIFGNSAYHQDHLPFKEQKEFVGHAVRHLYYVCGASDIAAEMDMPEYRSALSALWEDLTLRKMYVTGGAGSRYEGEAFGEAYELPNERAYTETCAAIASVMWNWRMLNITGDAKYADLMERTLFNAVLPGLSLDGLHYFYQNPLADRGKHRRQEWFGCACCPPNTARLLASITGYFYSVNREGVYCHLYASGTASISLPGGGEMNVKQLTDYPWDGDICMEIKLSDTESSTLYVRIPGWAENALLSIDGDTHSTRAVRSGCYHRVAVKNGTRIDIELPLPAKRIACHPHVSCNLGRVALQRGPLIYCIEQADHDADVWDIALPDDAELTAHYRPNLPGGVVVITGEAIAIPPASSSLYTQYAPDEVIATTPVKFTAIPYFAWANREPGPMQVWIPTLPAVDYE
jgi:DUF1680 family protein